MSVIDKILLVPIKDITHEDQRLLRHYSELERDPALLGWMMQLQDDFHSLVWLESPPEHGWAHTRELGFSEAFIACLEKADANNAELVLFNYETGE